MGLADIKKRQRRAFGDRLRAAREAAGFERQEDFGERIGANRVTISRWESGASGVGPEYHDAIKRVLKLDDSFFDENETLRIMNESLIEQIKTLKAQLAKQSARQKGNKPLK